MIKGFALNDEKLKNICAQNFWIKVLDIYATSIDYNPKDKLSINFFKIVQNKMHYAPHGNTAAEVIFYRVDSEKDNLGLTNFKGDYPIKSETEIAKNYLTEEELNKLNIMVSTYLDIAEINALDRHPMTMQDWIDELDSFSKINKLHSRNIKTAYAIMKNVTIRNSNITSNNMYDNSFGIDFKLVYADYNFHPL